MVDIERVFSDGQDYIDHKPCLSLSTLFIYLDGGLYERNMENY